jgi:hypothetical protein
MAGAEVCGKFHGAAPQAKAAARRRLAHGEALKALAEMDVEPLGDPMEALAELAADAIAYYRWCAERVNALKEQLRYEHEKAAEQLRAEIGMYERAMERAQKFIADYRKLQIAEHPIKVEHSGEVRTIHDLLTNIKPPALTGQED